MLHILEYLVALNTATLLGYTYIFFGGFASSIVSFLLPTLHVAPLCCSVVTFNHVRGLIGKFYSP